MGQITRHKLQSHDVSPQLAQGMAQQLPFPRDSFAAIVSTFPTNFIIQPETLQEVYRVLQAGGCLVTVLNGTLTGEGIVADGLEWLYRITGQRDDMDTDMLDYFDGYGFSVEVKTHQCEGSTAHLVILRK